jgi:dTDP-4-dehydrorhamnose 3,5-epimerase
MDKPEKISLKRFTDDRGDFMNVPFDAFAPKRAYSIVNSQKGVIRAFHGHKKEWKAFLVLNGTATFRFVELGKEDSVDKNIIEYTLSNNNPEMIVCPPNWYNGFVNRSENVSIFVLSSSTMEESKNDDIRLPANAFGDWEVKHR